MSQPDWKLLTNLGDVDYIEYGGFLVFVDATGTYPPEAEIVEPPEKEEGWWAVSRVVLEQCYYTTASHRCDRPAGCNGECRRNFGRWVLSDNEFHQGSEAWFAGKLESVSETADYPGGVSALRLDLCTRETRRRASAYRDLIGYFGVFEFDQYPERFSRAEIEERYS